MSGFSTVFIVSSSGGVFGADGMTDPQVLILLGEGERQWFEAHYVFGSEESNRLGNIKSIVPAGPYDSIALLDAVIAYHASSFRGCPSFATVLHQLGSTTFLDFHASKDNVPEAWGALREEARSIFEGLTIYRAELDLLTVSELSKGAVYGRYAPARY